MKSRTVLLSYSLLMVALIGATVFLALEVRAYMEIRGTDPLENIRRAAPNQQDIEAEMAREEQQERQRVLFTFNRSTAFSPLATRVPIPTPTPMPIPSPTPPIPAKGYTYKFVMRNAAMIVGYDHQERYVKVGDVVEDGAIGNFKILETIPGLQGAQVKVEHVDTGTVGFISEQFTGKSGNQ